MAQALELHETHATLGKNACAQLTIEQAVDLWPSMVLDLRRIAHVWSRWWTEEALFFQISSGHMQVWVAGPPPTFHLVIVTQVMNYPANSILQAVLMFGTKVDKVLPLVVGTLEHYAQTRGCRYAEIFGRPGWKKKLGPFGYTEGASVLMKPLGELRRH